MKKEKQVRFILKGRLQIPPLMFCEFKQINLPLFPLNFSLKKGDVVALFLYHSLKDFLLKVL